MLIIQTWDSVCIYGFTQNLRNEEQVAIIQASTVLSLAEKVRGCLELYTVWYYSALYTVWYYSALN